MADTAPLFIHPLTGPHDTRHGYLVEVAEDATADTGLLTTLTTHPALAGFDTRQPWYLPTDVAPPLPPGPEAPAETDEAAGEVATAPALPARRPPFVPVACRDEALMAAGAALSLRPGALPPDTVRWKTLILGIGHARTLPSAVLSAWTRAGQVIVLGTPGNADHTWAIQHGSAATTSEFTLTYTPGVQKPDLTRARLIELLALLSQDADTSQIERIIRQEPKLSYSLLRLVNSAANAPRSPITSFTQAINVLGRRQLQRWLQLLVYADPNNGQHPNPLLEKAAARGRLMENLAPRLGDEAISGEAAFMAGCFSLLDILLHLPMHDVVACVPLPDIVRQTLAMHQGPLGTLLSVIDAAERRQLVAAASKLATLPVTPVEFLDAQLDALSWAAAIHPPG